MAATWTPGARLGAWGGGAVEAGGLAALAVVPVLFNVHTTSTFALDKVSALRTLAVTVAVAWLLGATLRCAPRSADPGDDLAVPPDLRRWTWLVLAWLAVVAVASAFSMAPRLSLLGSPTRVQGLYTTAGYVILHLAAIALLRRRDQLERVLTVAILTSLPVALYGVIQHFGTDPVPWARSSSTRVASTLGNPIFVGAFLVLVIPLTVARFAGAVRDVTRGEQGSVRAILMAAAPANVVLQVAAWWIGPAIGTVSSALTIVIWLVEGRLLGRAWQPFLRVATCSVMLSAQVACLLLTKSRGPWLGLFAGLGVFALAWAIARGRRRLAWTVCAAGLLLAAALAAANLAGAARSADGDEDLLGRFGRLAGASGTARLLIWQSATSLMASDAARNVIGYGPETLRLAVAPHVPPALGSIERRGALPDRAHNATIDAWVTTGVPGAAIYLAIFALLAVRALRGAGLLDSTRGPAALVGLMSGAGALSAAGARALDGSWRLTGLALPLGMVAGLCVFLLARARPSRVAGDRDDLLALALLSALVAHFVESQFGLAVTSTLLYFWMFAALVVAAPRAAPPTATAEDPAGADRREVGQHGAIACALVISLVLAILVFDFSSYAAAAPGAIAWLLGFTWSAGALLAVSAVDRRAGVAAVPRALGLYAAWTLAPLAVFGAGHAVLARVAGAAAQPWWLHAWLMAFVAGAGVVLAIGPRRDGAAARSAVPVFAAAIGAGVLLLAVVAHVTAVRADIVYKKALHPSPASRAEAADRARRAIALAPDEGAYRALLAEILLDRAGRAVPAEGAALVAEAERTLAEAARRSPRDPEFPAHLARLHVRWATRAGSAEARERLLDRAILRYREALALHPANVLVWNELGVAQYLRDDLDAALATFRRSRDLDGQLVETHLHLVNVHRRRGDEEAARRALDAARSLVPPAQRSTLEDLAESLSPPRR